MELVANPSCNTSTLQPYEPTSQNIWDTSKVNHVFRRLGFGASQTEIDAALAMTPGDFIDSLVDTAFNLPPTTAPPWGYWSYNDFTDYGAENDQYKFDWRIQTGNDIISDGFRGRMAFFWMNHFVTEVEVYDHCAYMFQYYNAIQTPSLGNFREFTRSIGTNPAMLLYLNGFENTNFNPNENYARELFELFTLGEGNGYTQDDILETARALTGYNHWLDYGGTIFFDSSTFDAGEKTIFGKTGFWGYDDIIDILFQERSSEIAFYICEKLYRFFVSPEVDATIEQDIIQPLANTLIANDFELVPMLKQLFKSEHFFDERAVGVVIKSPFDLTFNYIKETGFFYDDTLMNAFIYYAGLMGQEMYEPLDVSGWQRDETWINASTLTGRWQLVELYLGYLFDNGLESSLVDFAKDLSNNSNDPYYITQVVIDRLMSKQLHSITDYDIATVIFKWEVPQNYYDDGLWNLDWSTAPYQVFLLLKHVATIPEFQLK